MGSNSNSNSIESPLIKGAQKFYMGGVIPSHCEGTNKKTVTNQTKQRVGTFYFGYSKIQYNLILTCTSANNDKFILNLNYFRVPPVKLIQEFI